MLGVFMNQQTRDHELTQFVGSDDQFKLKMVCSRVVDGRFERSRVFILNSDLKNHQSLLTLVLLRQNTCDTHQSKG